MVVVGSEADCRNIVLVMITNQTKLNGSLIFL